LESWKHSKRTTAKYLIEGEVVGSVEIQRVGLSAVVFEGTTDSTLTQGVGHYSKSPEPGAQGNVVLAGHRDTVFRPLRYVKVGDVVKITTDSGVFAYKVERTEVVSPEATHVLNPTRDDELTLITCYPFRFWGNAPQRFIVHAKRWDLVGKGFPAVFPNSPIWPSSPLQRF